jgi:hypothetical protein
MPWHIVNNSTQCDSDEPYAVVKEGTGELEGCHPTREAAEEQMKALYASEGEDSSATVYPEWEGTIVVEGTATGDGREFAEGSLSWAELPIPLRWNKEDSHGGELHTVAVNVGRIDKVWRDGSKIMGSGVFNINEEDGARAYQLVKDKFLKGVSIDADDISDSDMEVIWPEIDPEDSEDDEVSILEMMFGMPEKIIFHAGRIRAATLCDIPAFVEAYISVREVECTQIEDTALIASAVGTHGTATTKSPWTASVNEKRLATPMEESVAKDMYAWLDSSQKEEGKYSKSAGKFPHHMVGGNGRPGAANTNACSAAIGALNGARGGADIPGSDRKGIYNHLAAHLRDAGMEPPELKAMEVVNSLVAHGAPDWAPSSEWFTNPRLNMPTGIMVSDEGRILGHAAVWGECHIGYADTCVTPPVEDAHPYFMTGEVVCADGSRVAVGQITLGTGHAALSLPAHAAAEHYDNTGTTVADVVVGNDGIGLWVAGAVRPDVSQARIRELRASGQLSGDWRRIGGKLRLVGLLAVNVPGFPVPKMTSRVASGKQLALTAAGHIKYDKAEPTLDQAALRNMMDVLIAHVHGMRD